METYPGLQYLDGFPEVIFFFKIVSLFKIFEGALNKLELVVNCDAFIILEMQVKVVLRADHATAMLDKVAIISGLWCWKVFEHDNV